LTTLSFEISVNGERVYTIGDKDWRALSAQIMGHNFLLEEMKRNGLTNDEDPPETDIKNINLHAWVAAPHNEQRTSGSMNTKSYDTKQLKPGDIVSIKIIADGEPDAPNVPMHDPDVDGAYAVRLVSSDEA